MGSPLLNKLVTRGMGPTRSVMQSSGLVVQGFGPIVPTFVVTTLADTVRRKGGQSGFKRRIDQLDEIIVWAKLVEVNGVEPNALIKGWVKAQADRRQARVSVEHVSTRARQVWESLKVTVRRLR